DFRQFPHDEVSRRPARRQPYASPPLQPRQTAFRVFIRVGQRGHKTRYWTSPVRDHDGLAMPNAIDQGAKLIFRFSYCGLLHIARIAISNLLKRELSHYTLVIFARWMM